MSGAMQQAPHFVHSMHRISNEFKVNTSAERYGDFNMRQLLTFCFVVGLGAMGCNSQKNAPAASSPSYKVSASVEGQGNDRELELSLVAEGGYKVNEEYPLSFVPEKSQTEVLFSSAQYALTPHTKKNCAEKKDAVCEVRAKVPFEATKDATQVEGVLKMSVCSLDKCLIEKVPVTAKIQPASL